MVEIVIPGRGPLKIASLLLDLNGTLAADGRVPVGVRERLERLTAHVRVVVATADTFGTASRELDVPGVEVRVLTPAFGAPQKEKILERLGPETTTAVGNGVNDHKMLARAALSVVVIGREGASWEALRRADVVVNDAADALDLLLVPTRLVATLRD